MTMALHNIETCDEKVDSQRLALRSVMDQQVSGALSRDAGTNADKQVFNFATKTTALRMCGATPNRSLILSRRCSSIFQGAQKNRQWMKHPTLFDS